MNKFFYILQRVILPKRHRTTVPVVQNILKTSDGGETLLTKECLKSYASNWNLVHYKYSGYGGTYLELPKYKNLLTYLSIIEL